jgi:hypothetical protein
MRENWCFWIWDSRVDGDIGSKILRDGIELASGMSEVFVSIFPKFPVLRLIIFVLSAEKENCNITWGQEEMKKNMKLNLLNLLEIEPDVIIQALH